MRNKEDFEKILFRKMDAPQYIIHDHRTDNLISINECLELMQYCYNEAIQDASEAAKAKTIHTRAVIDKQSILRLKIQDKI